MDSKDHIIRKLGGSEALYTEFIRNGSFINTRAALMGSKIDLYADINKLYQAITYWKQSHHFLRCNIVADEKGEYYFAYAPKDIFDDIRNISLLKLDKKSNRNIEDTWQLFVERELIKPIGIERLLWRLFFIQIENDKIDNNTFQYYVIFNASHATIDGPNAFHVIMHLMQIIEKTYLNEHVEILSYEVVPPLDEHPEVVEYKRKMQTENKNKSSEHSEEQIVIIKMPDGFKSDHYPNPPPVDYSKRCDDVFLTHNNQLYATYNEILEESKNFHTKTVGFILDSDDFSKILKKCKMHDLKLTGCLNMILVIAFQKVVKLFDNKEHPIPYMTPLTIRTRLNPRIEDIRMGYCTAFMNEIFNEYYDVEESDFWLKKFWQLAKKESDSMHLKLKNREYLKHLVEDRDFYHEFIALDKNPDYTTYYHIGLSNRGDLTQYSYTESKALWIKESYTGGSYGPGNKFMTFLHFIESFNKRLFWSFTYNHNLVKPAVGEAYEAEIKNIFRKLIG